MVSSAAKVDQISPNSRPGGWMLETICEAQFLLDIYILVRLPGGGFDGLDALSEVLVVLGDRVRKTRQPLK